MPFRAELYAVVPEDLTRMVACYRPMGFLDHPIDSPIDPARARAWLAACAPLFERLGGQASADLLARAKELREHSHSWEFVPGQPAPGDFNVHYLFELLATEYLAKAVRFHTSARYTIRNEAVCEAWHRRNLDGGLLVPIWPAVHEPDRAHSFASSPITHAPFGRFFVWRSAEEVRAFFEPKGWFRKRVEDPLKPPTPEQVVAIKRSRSFYVSDTSGLEDARRAIDDTREDWATEVELLRTAARFGGAFLGVCKDITDYE